MKDLPPNKVRTNTRLTTSLQTPERSEASNFQTFLTSHLPFWHIYRYLYYQHSGIERKPTHTHERGERGCTFSD